MKENIKIFNFKNKTKLIVEKDDNSKYIAFAIHVGVGAGNENENEFGAAHFLEHLFFKSTKDMSTQQIATYLESLGAKINALTNDVKTVYHFQCLNENFEKCLEMYSKMFLFGVFKKNEIEKEKSVILEELKRALDSPIHVAYMNSFKHLMNKNRFGHDVLGTEETIKNMNKELLLNFRKKHYIPQNVIFSLYGNLDFIEAKKMFEKYFKSFLLIDNSLECSNTNEQIIIKPSKNLIIEEQDRNQAQIYILFKSIKADHPLRYSVHLFQDILGGGMSSRLFVQLRERMGLVYSTWAECYSCKEFGIMGIYIGKSPKNVKVALNNVKKILKKLATDGITKDELVKAKNNLKSAKVYSLDSKMQIAKLNAIKYNIFNYIPSLEEEFKKIDEVTIEDVNSAAKMLYNEKNFVVSIVGKGINKETIKF